MNRRENALQIIRFGKPERVVTALPVHTVDYLGCNHQGYDGVGDDCPVGTAWTDIWGIGWRKEQRGIMGFPVSHPLAEVAALKDFAWPDPDDERICGQIHRKAAERVDGDSFLGGSHRNLLLEKLEKLIGMEQLMEYFYTEPGFVREVSHRYMDFQIGIARHYIDVGVETVRFSEDLGTQRSLLVSPAIISEFLIPEYERLLSLYRARGTIIHLHSCGHVEPLLPTFERLGVAVLNPVQVTANDLDRVRSATQGRMALHGAVNSDTVMTGPIARIVAEVRQRLWQLGRNGGYFCTVDQGMDYPKEHLDALNQAVESYGRYPIEEPSAGLSN